MFRHTQRCAFVESIGEKRLAGQPRQQQRASQIQRLFHDAFGGGLVEREDVKFSFGKFVANLLHWNPKLPLFFIITPSQRHH